MNWRLAAMAALCGGAFLVASAMPGMAKDAEKIKTPINKISDSGIEDEIGFVTIVEGKDGLEMFVDIVGLAPGPHGMHVHEKGDCAPGLKDGKQVAGLSAGGHLDPDQTKAHKGPKELGHKGDLPLVEADAHGKVQQKVNAPHLSLADVQGKALMFHAGGDTYSDTPPLGGGGARVACGVIK